MNNAFSEDEDHSQDTREIRDAWVLGAAQWILWNGQQLFKLLHWREALGTSSALLEKHRDEDGIRFRGRIAGMSGNVSSKGLLRPVLMARNVLMFVRGW